MQSTSSVDFSVEFASVPEKESKVYISALQLPAAQTFK